MRERAGDVAQPEPVDQRAPPRRRVGRAPRTRPASSTFASPVSSGSRWKNWNTKPMWRRRSAESARSPTPVTRARPRPRPCPPRAGRARRARAAASTCPTPSGRARRRSRPPRRRGRRRRAPAAPRGPRRRSGPARARQTSAIDSTVGAYAGGRVPGSIGQIARPREYDPGAVVVGGMTASIPHMETGTVLGGYRIDGVAGQGGMGVVYRATQLGLDRHVALKVIAAEFAENLDFRNRFKSEAQLAASIDHPNVVPIFETGESEGTLYLAMRYVEGTDLRTLVESDGGLDAERAVRIIWQVGAALDAAHRRGLVHRDVKPPNVLIAHEGEEHAYLTDFGLTKHAAARVRRLHPHGPLRRHARLRRPRADPRRAGRRPRGRLRARRAALPRAHRPRPVPARQRAGEDVRAPQRPGARRDPARAARHADRARRRDRHGDGEGPGRALRVGRRPRARRLGRAAGRGHARPDGQRRHGRWRPSRPRPRPTPRRRARRRRPRSPPPPPAARLVRRLPSPRVRRTGQAEGRQRTRELAQGPPHRPARRPPAAARRRARASPRSARWAATRSRTAATPPPSSRPRETVQPPAEGRRRPRS